MSIEQLVEERLEATGASESEGEAMIQAARARSGLSEEEATELAVAETRASRQKRRS